MKKVLVTGANGLIGGAVLETLAQSGAYSLIGTVRNNAGAQPEREGVAFAVFDITNEVHIESLREQYCGVDAVIHTAAVITKEPYDTSVISANCLGTLNTVKLAMAMGAARFIYISSIQVIGRPLSLPITESHPVNPRSLYHLSKLFGEQVLLLEENRALHPVILRIPSPVGPGMKPGGIVSVFLTKASRNEDIPLYGKGGREQNYLDTRDIAMAVMRALRTTPVGIFNIAAARSVTNLELAECCKAVCGSNSRIVYTGQDDPEESFQWRIATDNASRGFGFLPRYSLMETLSFAFSHGRTDTVRVCG